MDRTPSDHALMIATENYDGVVQIDKREMKNLVAEEVNLVCAERFQAEVWANIEKRLADMPELGNSAAAK